MLVYLEMVVKMHKDYFKSEKNALDVSDFIQKSVKMTNLQNDILATDEFCSGHGGVSRLC